MPFPDFAADPLEPKPIIDGLQEKVAARIKFLAVIIQLPVGAEWHQDGSGRIVRFIFLCLQPGLLPGSCHHAVPVSAKCLSKLFECAKLADSFGSALAVTVYVGLGYIKRL